MSDDDYFDENKDLPEGYGALRVYECSCDTNYICLSCQREM